MTTEYIFDTGSDQGHVQVSHLSELYDGVTRARLERAGISTGQRCLEVGAGNGSIARMLAREVGPSGHVVAADIETSGLEPSDGVTIVRHDLNHGVPPGGPFDLIHARLVLMHLSRRVELLGTLVDALEPGGRIVLGDFGEQLPRALDAPSDEDAELVDRIVRMGMQDLAPKVGMSVSWAENLAATLQSAGLKDIDLQRISRTCDGGTSGCLVLRSYLLQLEAPLRKMGVTLDELTRFAALMTDPQMRISFYELIYVSGQK